MKKTFPRMPEMAFQSIKFSEEHTPGESVVCHNFNTLPGF